MSDSALALPSVNNFPSPNITDFSLELEALRSEITQLRDDRERDQQEIEDLKEKIKSLEQQQDRDFDRFVDKINEHSAAINTIWKASKTTTPPKGEKTEARIKKLKETLKARRSGITFKEAEKLLGIKPNQMTKLVSQLDKRSFEVFPRAGNKREMVIRLKSFT